MAGSFVVRRFGAIGAGASAFYKFAKIFQRFECSRVPRTEIRFAFFSFFSLFELRIGRTACNGILSKLRLVYSGSFISMSSPVRD